MSNRKFIGYRDWRLTDIFVDDIILTTQGTKFVVCEDSEHGICLLQINKGDYKEGYGCLFELKAYMQPNMEVIGNIHDNPELLK